jgi:hypothetical protein
MGRIFLLVAALAAFTVPAALSAATPDDGTLSVKRGRGALTLKLKGTVIGRVANGRVLVKDFRPFDDNDPHLTGCNRGLRRPSFSVWICRGRRIAFRVDDGRFNVGVRGRGIWISAVGRGPFAVDGAGNLGFADGVMSIDGEPYQSLPDEPTAFFLGTPQLRR